MLFGNGFVPVPDAAMTSVVFMKPLSIVLWYRPMAWPVSCTTVRKYGAGARPKRRPFTSPHSAVLGIIQCDDTAQPSRGTLLESEAKASNMMPRGVESRRRTAIT